MFKKHKVLMMRLKMISQQLVLQRVLLTATDLFLFGGVMLDECFRNSTYSAVHGMAKFGASFASLHRRFATAGFYFSASHFSIKIVGKSFGVFTGSTHSTNKI